MIDLHSHSTASDGVLTPVELVHAAVAAGVRTLALTDHDTIAGYPVAAAAGQAHGLEVLCGVEISTTAGQGRATHVLGYLFDPDDAGLARTLARVIHGRADRNQAIADRLAALGMPIDLDRVRALAGGTVGRPHFARAMVIEGYAATMDDAFDRWLGDGKPACVDQAALTPAEAVTAIHGAGGVAVLAHPLTHGRAPQQVDRALREAALQGFDGVEVYYRNHTPGEVKMVRSLATQHGLVGTGGSDTHSLPWAPSPGVPADVLDRLRSRAARRAAA